MSLSFTLPICDCGGRSWLGARDSLTLFRCLTCGAEIVAKWVSDAPPAPVDSVPVLVSPSPGAVYYAAVEHKDPVAASLGAHLGVAPETIRHDLDAACYWDGLSVRPLRNGRAEVSFQGRREREEAKPPITINIRAGVHFGPNPSEVAAQILRSPTPSHPPEVLATHAAIGEMVGRWNRERAEKDAILVLMDVAEMWACMPDTTEMLRRSIALTVSPYGRRHIARVARETTFRRVMGFVAEFARLQVAYDAAALSRPFLTRGDWLAMRPTPHQINASASQDASSASVSASSDGARGDLPYAPGARASSPPHDPSTSAGEPLRRGER